jgi:hypothetical protein
MLSCPSRWLRPARNGPPFGRQHRPDRRPCSADSAQRFCQGRARAHRHCALPTWMLYLLPSDASGIWNTCRFATPGCRAACLAESGQQGMETRSGHKEDGHIYRGRLARLLFLGSNPQAFLRILAHELSRLPEPSGPPRGSPWVSGPTGSRTFPSRPWSRGSLRTSRPLASRRTTTPHGPLAVGIVRRLWSTSWTPSRRLTATPMSTPWPVRLSSSTSSGVRPSPASGGDGRSSTPIARTPGSSTPKEPSEASGTSTLPPAPRPMPWHRDSSAPSSPAQEDACAPRKDSP